MTQQDGHAIGAAATPPPAARRFARHYVEMFVVMLVGTVVLGRLDASLTSTAHHRQHVPDTMAIRAVLMAAAMTVAMAGWMRFRHHHPRLIIEVAAGMNAPFLVLVPLWAVGIGAQEPMTTAHVSMYAGMSAAMVIRRHEFVRHGRAGLGAAT